MPIDNDTLLFLTYSYITLITTDVSTTVQLSCFWTAHLCTISHLWLRRLIGTWIARCLHYDGHWTSLPDPIGFAKSQWELAKWCQWAVVYVVGGTVRASSCYGIFIRSPSPRSTTAAHCCKQSPWHAVSTFHSLIGPHSPATIGKFIPQT